MRDIDTFTTMHDPEKGNGMLSRLEASERDGFASLESSDIEVLSSADERSLLRQLAACKSKLAQSLWQTPPRRAKTCASGVAICVAFGS